MTGPGGVTGSAARGVSQGIHVPRLSRRRIQASERRHQKRTRGTEGSQWRQSQGTGWLIGGGRGRLVGTISDKGDLELGRTNDDGRLWGDNSLQFLNQMYQNQAQLTLSCRSMGGIPLHALVLHKKAHWDGWCSQLMHLVRLHVECGLREEEGLRHLLWFRLRSRHGLWVCGELGQLVHEGHGRQLAGLWDCSVAVLASSARQMVNGELFTSPHST